MRSQVRVKCALLFGSLLRSNGCIIRVLMQPPSIIVQIFESTRLLQTSRSLLDLVTVHMRNAIVVLMSVQSLCAHCNFILHIGCHPKLIGVYVCIMCIMYRHADRMPSRAIGIPPTLAIDLLGVRCFLARVVVAVAVADVDAVDAVAAVAAAAAAAAASAVALLLLLLLPLLLLLLCEHILYIHVYIYYTVYIYIYIIYIYVYIYIYIICI
jgi:hypothetical protein